MSIIIHPWQLFLLSLSGWINRHKQHAIEHMITGNQILKGKLGKKRIFLNDNQRSRPAVNGKLLGRKFLSKIATRRVHFAGFSTSPEELWMKQIARNLTDAFMVS
jgi:hypothetical protein